MFNNFLILDDNNGKMLYLFINNYKSFKKYYRLYKKNDINKIKKKTYSLLKYNKKKYDGNKVTIVVEGVITDVIEIKK